MWGLVDDIPRNIPRYFPHSMDLHTVVSELTRRDNVLLKEFQFLLTKSSIGCSDIISLITAGDQLIRSLLINLPHFVH